MKITIPSVSLTKQSVSEIASTIDSAKDGLLWVHDLPAAPLDTALATLLDHLAADDSLGERLNQAYTNNLVYKDSYKAGKGGPTVDRKRVLDLSPERLEIIAKADPALLETNNDHVGQVSLQESLAFWDKLSHSSKKISEALAMAIGSDEMLKDVFFNYRMVDYYPSGETKKEDEELEGPRCGEHRDFGSFTLIYTNQPGLQIFQEPTKTWVDIPNDANEQSHCSAILLFGWCTQIRSNGRIPAVLHRVVDDTNARRVSAVLFTAPKHAETPLEPVVRPGEEPRYISGVQVGQLRGNMARKWQCREGTISPENAVLEEEEIRVQPHRKTQDDVIRDLVAVVSK